MSASLVGSEMCIRDRAHVQSTHRHSRRPGGQASIRAAPKGTKPLSALACLLYTSDAADDM
eukprot:8744809-Alexandrium_andersonii.AAC.1